MKGQSLIKKATPVMFFFGIVLVVAGCSSVKDTKIFSKKYQIDQICIKEYMLSTTGDILKVMEEEFQAAGIKTKRYQLIKPSGCEYTVSYEAERAWKPAPYLSVADFHLQKKGEEIAAVSYEYDKKMLKLPLSQWSSTEKKIRPVIKKLLKKVGY